MARSEDGGRNRVFDTAMAAPVVEIPRSEFPHNTSDSLNMKSKEDRLTTFSGWPLSFMSENSLATAGFYYLHKGDVVRCAFCGVEVGHWEVGDNPMEEHRRWSPSCPLLRKSASNAGRTAVSTTNGNGNPAYDECGLYGIEIRPNSGPENGKHLLEQLGVSKNRGPLYREYASFNARMRSFETWPLSLKPRPEQLVEAGFFYTEPSLEEENRRLKEARLCKICMDEEVGAVFVPCGHLATCVNCAASVQDCPMCRQPIKATVRTFLS